MYVLFQNTPYLQKRILLGKGTWKQARTAFKYPHGSSVFPEITTKDFKKIHINTEKQECHKQAENLWKEEKTQIRSMDKNKNHSPKHIGAYCLGSRLVAGPANKESMG